MHYLQKVMSHFTGIYHKVYAVEKKPVFTSFYTKPTIKLLHTQYTRFQHVSKRTLNDGYIHLISRSLVQILLWSQM